MPWWMLGITICGISLWTLSLLGSMFMIVGLFLGPV
jgi:hypothetical protein